VGRVGETDGRAAEEIRGLRQRVAELEELEARHRRTEEELKAAQEYAQNLIDNSLNMIISVDRARRIVEFNPAAQKTFGYGKPEVIGKHVDALYADRTQGLNVHAALVESGQFTGEILNRRKDGQTITSFLAASTMRDGKGRVLGIMGISRDVTELKRVEKELSAARQYASRIIDSSPDMIICVDADRKIAEFNPAAQKAFGYTRDEALGRDVDMLYADPSQSMHVHDVVASTGQFSGEVANRTKDGRVFTSFLAASVMKDESGHLIGVMGISQDITDRKRSEEQLAYMATHDLLTGLANRDLLNDRLRVSLARAERSRRRLAVMLLDLDHFKSINDTLGHQAGDQLLRAVAERLKQRLRRSDTVARWGGDEFVVVLPEIAEADDALRVALKAQRAFQEPFAVDDNELSVTASIGIATYPDDGANADTLIRHADAALYRAKESGRNTCRRFSTERAPTFAN